MSLEKNEIPKKPEVLEIKTTSLPGNLEDLPAYVPPRPTNLDPHHGRTTHNPAPSLLDLDPANMLPPPPPPPPARHIPTEDLFDFSHLEDEIKRARSPSTDEDDECDSGKGKKPAKPTPAKRTKLAAAKPKPQPSKQPLSQPSQINHPMSKPATDTSVNIPRWGVDFPKTGFIPSGSTLESGSLKGHFSKEACRSTPPAGVNEEDWKRKFRSAESVLMKQLKNLHGNKEGKAKLDKMRDEGWVRDRALYMLQVEKDKKAEKKPEGEVEQEDEDVEMAEGAEEKAKEADEDE